MKLAVVSHLAGLEAVDRVGLSYHMALAQHLLLDDAYRAYYLDKHRLGHFIIVDNGAHEGETPPFAQVVLAAAAIGADEIVMPDIIGNAAETVKATADSDAQMLVPPRKRMIVPHGQNWREWVWCFEELRGKLQFATVGIPKYLEGWEGGRERALHYLHLAGTLDELNVHLLGSWEHPRNEVRPKYFQHLYNRVRGIDTSAPIAWAQSNLEIDTGGLNKQLIRWDKEVPLKLAERNIKIVNEWCWWSGTWTGE